MTVLRHQCSSTQHDQINQKQRQLQAVLHSVQCPHAALPSVPRKIDRSQTPPQSKFWSPLPPAFNLAFAESSTHGSDKGRSTKQGSALAFAVEPLTGDASICHAVSPHADSKAELLSSVAFCGSTAGDDDLWVQEHCQRRSQLQHCSTQQVAMSLKSPRKTSSSTATGADVSADGCGGSGAALDLASRGVAIDGRGVCWPEEETRGTLTSDRRGETDALPRLMRAGRSEIERRRPSGRESQPMPPQLRRAPPTCVSAELGC
eukprot:CAMPEP_0177539578 /NCGR_PEP_ID=MMETSP0369-20130122/59051_1 /TAXON_ID=447022 ORGANISM="Scrippsiella hangoei-like, Strain SHHI-4" /NCGR_SAMPLE_ID=MMETSP0369 /ASSEMBLY_ACC=CAM_ASM_000364 /LENGTH=260 /DNA_ID=CAMNT_0019022597 /DNA_START=57 /DNA_END=836 /DNA_ORIENTATION=-